jgi:hypothetical protein
LFTVVALAGCATATDDAAPAGELDSSAATAAAILI